MNDLKLVRDVNLLNDFLELKGSKESEYGHFFQQFEKDNKGIENARTFIVD